MIIVKCIRNVEKDLNVIKLELEREKNKLDSDSQFVSELEKQKTELENYLEDYKKNLSELDDMEARIYYKIVYGGLNPMKAINEVAEENYLNGRKPADSDYILKKYYLNVKKILKV